MKQEEKDLLLKDLCARLPYGVKCNVGDDKPYTLSRIEIDYKNGHLLDFKEKKGGLDMQVYLSECRPYLFPLSSMTGDQKSAHNFLKNSAYANPISLIKFYHKNHFDYNKLIPKGLANDATGLNIY